VHRLSLALTAVLTLAACGSSDSASTTSAPATTTTAQAPRPANAEPKGKLSRPEYRSLRAAYDALERLEKTKDLGKVVRVGSRACLKLTTQTELLAAVHADCVQAIRFLGKARQMVTRKAECTRAGQAGDISCFADLFRSLGRSARVEMVRAGAVNSVLHKRRIRGQCAAGIGTNKRELAAVRRVVHDALGAAHALEARNEGAFQRAASNLQVDLDAIDSGSAGNTPRQLKACR
jgi:hypothetical protein